MVQFADGQRKLMHEVNRLSGVQENLKRLFCIPGLKDDLEAVRYALVCGYDLND
jgi:hypothetical protein